MRKILSFVVMMMMLVSASAVTMVKVTGNGVRLRTSPSTYDNSNVVGSVNSGTLLDYIDTYGDFYKASYKGYVVYISRDYSSLKEVARASSSTNISTGSGPHYTQVVVGNHNKIRLRTCPSTNCDYLIWTNSGQTIYVYAGDAFEYLGEKSNGFYHIKYRGVECWIASEFCYLR